nr:integrase, catalytic region, zinc finger, CCHC-type, peptidase aspartic, catalytic [Tanacetum cinerariifolium]
MANHLEDIQCVGFDTRPPMLDRTAFASWQQRIRLYCQGKENGVNILKSIDEGPFQMGTVREPLAEGTERAPHLGLPKDVYTLINHYTDAKDIWDNVEMLLEGAHSKELHSNQASTELHFYKDKMLLMQAQENRVALDAKQLLFLTGGQDNDIDDDVDKQHVQDLALNVDNVFEADDYDAFDSDVDKAPTAQTMFMANLSSADPVNDEVGPSYDSYILSE